MHLIDDPGAPPSPETDFDTFRKIDIRLGTVRAAAPLEGARKPSITLEIDFGPGVGVKQSAAQITEHYACDALIGRRVMAVVNFPPRRIAGFKSECLTLGVADASGAITLIAPDHDAPDGARLA
ncbi:MAG: tRNA-binding protein [Pseudomonadota bacterium]